MFSSLSANLFVFMLQCIGLIFRVPVAIHDWLKERNLFRLLAQLSAERLCCAVDVPGTPSLLQLEADNDDQVTLTCLASATRSKPSELAPELQYVWIVDDQPLNETTSNVSSIAVARDSGLAYRCMTREIGSRLHSLPSNELLMLTRLLRSSCDTCKSTVRTSHAVRPLFDRTTL